MPSEDQQWPGYTGESHPDVWNLSAKPPQPKEKKIGQLTEEQVNEYFEKGVVLVEDYFLPEELEPIKEDIKQRVSDLANHLYQGGKIKSKYEEYGLFQRMTMINKEYPGSNVILVNNGSMPDSIRELWSGDKLCNAVEQLIGPDIGGNPVWNLRPKTPHDEQTVVPWHQDNAYLDGDAYKTHIVTAWIPMLNSDASNGCMEFAVGGHATGKVAMHQCCAGDTHYVMMELDQMVNDLGVDLKKDLKVMPVKFGSLLLFSNIIPHRSLDNLTGFPGVVRWSIDLRWQDHRKPWGFYGIAHGVPFRKSDDPNWRPSDEDWSAFTKIVREKTEDSLNEKKDEKSVTDLFKTTITGPWMKNWELVNMNRHTDGLAEISGSDWPWHHHD